MRGCFEFGPRVRFVGLPNVGGGAVEGSVWLLLWLWGLRGRVLLAWGCASPLGFCLGVVVLAWSSSDRRSRLPADWPTRREQVLVRDGRVCQWRVGGRKCGAPARDVDHVVPGDDHSYSNLRALCSAHHQRKSSGEGGRAFWDGVRDSRAKFREGRVERHPGDLS